VAPGTCPQCGAPNPPDAAFCQFCSAKLPWSSPPPPSAPAYQPLPAPQVPPTRESNAVIVIVVVVVVILIAGIAFFATLVPSTSLPSLPGTNGVVVTQVVAISGDDACGLNGVNENGFTTNVGEYRLLAWFVPASQSVSPPCTVNSITTNTAGFEVLASVPFTASSDMTLLSFQVVSYSPYNGPLNITFT